VPEKHPAIVLNRVQSQWPDSNRRPAVYKTAALPTELHWQSTLKEQTEKSWLPGEHPHLFCSSGRLRRYIVCRDHQVLMNLFSGSEQNIQEHHPKTHGVEAAEMESKLFTPKTPKLSNIPDLVNIMSTLLFDLLRDLLFFFFFPVPVIHPEACKNGYYKHYKPSVYIQVLPDHRPVFFDKPAHRQ
jgi:hypothetical protein